MATAAKFDLPIAIFLAYLIQLDVDVTGNRGTKIMGWGDVRYCFAMAILVIIIILPHIFVRSISRPHTTVDIPTKFHEA
jgi:hypothetical protein